MQLLTTLVICSFVTRTNKANRRAQQWYGAVLTSSISDKRLKAVPYSVAVLYGRRSVASKNDPDALSIKPEYQAINKEDPPRSSSERSESCPLSGFIQYKSTFQAVGARTRRVLQVKERSGRILPIERIRTVQEYLPSGRCEFYSKKNLPWEVSNSTSRFERRLFTVSV